MKEGVNVRYNNLPEYNKAMYLMGYSANQVYQAFRQSNRKKKNKKKKDESILEKEIFAIMEKSLEAALDVALDEIFEDWK